MNSCLRREGARLTAWPTMMAGIDFYFISRVSLAVLEISYVSQTSLDTGGPSSISGLLLM